MIYITGDTHGDFEDLNSRKIKGLKKGDKLIITGDFGFLWDNSSEEIKNLKKLQKKKFDILFVEGAHENFDRIRELPECDLYCAKGYKIASNIYCLKRGEVYTIDGVTILALGGGLDPLIADPTTDNPPSLPSDEELQHTVDNIGKYRRKVDIIVTHEPPASVKRVIDRNAEINDLNIFLDTVLHNVRCKKWYFGSLHEDRELSEKLCCVWQDVRSI